MGQGQEAGYSEHGSLVRWQLALNLRGSFHVYRCSLVPNDTLIPYP